MKHNFKRVCALLLAVVMCIGATLPVFASGSGENTPCPGQGIIHTKDNCEYTLHVVYDPACMTLGYTVYKCNTCGEFFADDFKPGLTGCEWDASKTEVIEEDLCDTVGKEKRWCTVHQRYTEFTVDEIKDHKWTEDGQGEGWTTDGKTCSETAVLTRTCLICGKVETKDNPDKTEHKWVLDHWLVDGEPGLPQCKSEYVKKDSNGVPVVDKNGDLVFEELEVWAVYVCTICESEHVVTDVRLDDLTHSFVDDNGELDYDNCFVGYSVEPTCDKGGVAIFECKNCYYQKEFDVPATGEHDFTKQFDAIEVTCTTDGRKAGLGCSVCDAPAPTGGYEIIPALGHKVKEGTVVYPNGETVCVVNGSYVCANCNETIGGGAYDTYTDRQGNSYTVDPDEKYLTPEYCGITGLLATGHIWTPGKPTVEIEATCDSFGFDIYACTKCGQDAHIDTYPMLNHKNKVKVTAANKDALIAQAAQDGVTITIANVSKDASCGVEGLIVEFCPDCYEVFEQELDALEHEIATKSVSANCQEAAYTQEYCKNCDYVGEKKYVEGSSKIEPGTEEYLDPDNHYDWIYKNYTTWPTCDTAGMAIFYCPKCSHYAESPVEAFGHDYYVKTPVDADNNGVVDVDKDGHPIYTYAKDADGNKIPSVKANSQVAATCTTDAYEYWTCTNLDKNGNVCGDELKVVDEGSKLNHKDPYVFVETVPPTCANGGKDGYDVYGCALCKKADGTYVETEQRNIVEYDEKNPEHHVHAELDTSDPRYPDGVVREGTCEVLGLWVYYCDACDFDFYYEVPNTGNGHSGPDHKDAVVTKKADCENKGSYVCAFCNEDVEIPATGHDLEWNTKVDPDCVTDGTKAHFECENCGKFFEADEETEVTAAELVIPALGHDFSVIPTGHSNCRVPIYKVCSRCDVESTADEDLVMAGHAHDMVKDPVTGEEGYVFLPGCDDGYDDKAEDIVKGYDDGYTHHYCQCDEEYCGCAREWIDGFKKHHKHTPEEIPAVDATCTTPGSTKGVKCAECGEILEAPEEVVTNHYNAAGDIIEIGVCQDEEKCKLDRYCVHCEETIDIHDYVVTVVPKNCITYKYTLYVCTVPGCPHQYMKEEPEEGYGEHIAADELVYDFTKACDVVGSALKVCKNCGITMEELVRGHKFDNYVTTLEPDIATPGSKTAYCAWGNVTGCDCEETDTQAIEALDGIKFHYSYDNAVKAGYNFVNTGKIALTIKYTAQNANVNDLLLALSYDADVLTYVEGDLECTGFNLDYCEIGGIVDAETNVGRVSIRARANDDKATENTNVTLPAEGVLAVLVFRINNDVENNTVIDVNVVTTGDGNSVVVDKEHNDVTAKYGEITEPTTNRLGDVNNDDVVNDKDVAKLLEILFAKGYVAEADIDQNGIINFDDYKLLKQYAISSITYADMCAGKAA